YLGSATVSAPPWSGTSAPRRIDLASPGGMNTYFGISLTSAGDVNGDGYADFLVDSNVGTAYVYLGAATPSATIWNGVAPPRRIDLTPPSGTTGNFGYTVTSVGDVNGDGYAEFLVGDGGSNAGAAYLYLGVATPSATVWNGTSPAGRI